MDLTIHHVIVGSSRTIVDDYIGAEDLNDPPFLYVLRPEALEVIEKHKRKFTDKSA